MLFIVLIPFVALVTVQYWGVSTNINILTGFIQFILSLSARINKSFPILHVTAQYAKARACAGVRNPKYENEQEYELELEAELEPGVQPEHKLVVLAPEPKDGSEVSNDSSRLGFVQSS
jgi:hypothetical protein